MIEKENKSDTDFVGLLLFTLFIGVGGIAIGIYEECHMDTKKNKHNMVDCDTTWAMCIDSIYPVVYPKGTKIIYSPTTAIRDSLDARKKRGIKY